MKNKFFQIGGTPKDDRYGQGPRRKALGYPKGEHSLFLDGRLLRRVQIDSTRGMLPTGAGVTTDTGALLVRQVENQRALYIPWVVAGTDHNYQDNVVASWQLWANNKKIAHAIAGQYRADVKVYVPPKSIVTFYLRCANTLGVAVYNRYAVPWIEFDAQTDKWDFGEGGFIANPAVGALTWP